MHSVCMSENERWMNLPSPPVCGGDLGGWFVMVLVGGLWWSWWARGFSNL